MCTHRNVRDASASERQVRSKPAAHRFGNSCQCKDQDLTHVKRRRCHRRGNICPMLLSNDAAPQRLWYICVFRTSGSSVRHCSIRASRAEIAPERCLLPPISHGTEATEEVWSRLHVLLSSASNTGMRSREPSRVGMMARVEGFGIEVHSDNPTRKPHFGRRKWSALECRSGLSAKLHRAFW